MLQKSYINYHRYIKDDIKEPYRESTYFNQDFYHCITTDDTIITRLSARNVGNYRDVEYVLAPVRQFGFSDVYSLIKAEDFDKMMNAPDVEPIIDEDEDDTVDRFYVPFTKQLLLASAAADEPLSFQTNTFIENIGYRLQDDIEIYIRNLGNLIRGANTYYEKNLVDRYLQAFVIPYDKDLVRHSGDRSSDPSNHKSMHLSDVFPSLNCLFDDHPFKYLIVDEKYHIYPTNQITHKIYNGVFVYLPNFNLWQYLTKKKFERLSRLKSVTVTYAQTDAPTCISTVQYKQQFIADNLVEIIEQSLFIAIDISMSRKLISLQEMTGDDDTRSEVFRLTSRYGSCYHEAIEIEVRHVDLTAKVLLTHEELGFKERRSERKYEDGPYYQLKKGYDFWVLGLINKVAKLKPR